jgi:hypothetical protein
MQNMLKLPLSIEFCCWDAKKKYRVFRRRFLFLCYIRLIMTSWFRWSHCHCYWRSGRLSFAMVGEFRVANVVWKKKSDQNNVLLCGKRKSSFHSTTFLQLSSRNSTGVLNFPCLKEWNKTKNGVWFYWFWKEVLDYLVLSRCFSKHQNKCRPALCIEVSSLCMGDSSFNHVLMHSPTVPRLDGKHQKTITLHSLPKRGVVVWWSGMWGIGILLRPEIYSASWPAFIT